MNPKKKSSLKVFPFVLSFLISLLLALLSILGVLRFTVCNASFMKAQVLKSNFCGEVVSELQENFISYGAAAGFSSNVMSVLVSKDLVQSEMFRSVDAFYAGEREIKPNPSRISDWSEHFKESVENLGFKATAEVQTGLVALAESCEMDFRGSVSVPLAKYLAPFVEKVTSALILPLIPLCLMLTAAIMLLLLLEKKHEMRLRQFAYATSSAALFSFLLPVFAKNILKPEKVAIQPESVRLLFVSYVNDTLSAFFYFGFIFAVITAACVATLLLRQKREKTFYTLQQSND